ncbi:bifunctional 4-hydroxy-2-oxoglutarate aldolase/2-dehydro-3-deoxy-phosphogluconate aldolase [Paenibacillus polysaccharolyticus]|uniref:bifunctional 4-hydroxy-2-oxoglutarate aldolase/2-dehydro-3-deoxy-phosphogluconate aldolase n=1 Tax=Paenibacillus polysaccharolyticus TaxID=582692 RepID=UPI00203F6DE3|nr:bifunctional 4-hydroxy-2-oxoglutarate aldolase/2-dehydro-3-deoxy-phosphogluconate aldolase [Paenibacillus polysaccharolyticus]MCM3136371.1 bifunctional 4-hydroxy-2-oxoglutarate aldolase/2-dehydro-3-deoxy-phosphogluconate aldolase [Paenibacillus polysaccharolyticus]
MNLTEVLLESRLVAIVRGISREAAVTAGQGMTEGGIRLMEVTLNTPNGHQIIADWRERHERQAYVGAGTVLNVSMAKEAVYAGAQFLVSPNVDLSVIEYAVEHGVEIWPGAMTPTEIVAAYEAGARAVKLFPMASLGIPYLREIKAPLDHIPLLATGGATLENIASYYEAGAAAVGLGSALLPKEALASGDSVQIADRARAFVEAATSRTDR